MADYIDREAFLADVAKRYCGPCKERGEDHQEMKCRACWVDDMLGDIEDAPAADVAPVRHGRWEWLGANELVRGCMCGTCSVCKVRSKYIANTAVCPNCGARMGGGEENATD